MTPAISLIVIGGILLVSGWQNRNVLDVALGRDRKRSGGSPGSVDAAGVASSPGGVQGIDSTLGGSMKHGNPTAQTTSVGPEHPTAGLPGYPAHDYFAPAGSACIAPVSGHVSKLSGHDPKSGPTMGIHGPFGWSVYIKGNDGHSYYLTHMGSRNVRVGQQVQRGQKIGTVGDYAKWGGANHIHMGIH